MSCKELIRNNNFSNGFLQFLIRCTLSVFINCLNLKVNVRIYMHWYIFFDAISKY